MPSGLSQDPPRTVSKFPPQDCLKILPGPSLHPPLGPSQYSPQDHLKISPDHSQDPPRTVSDPPRIVSRAPVGATALSWPLQARRAPSSIRTARAITYDPWTPGAGSDPMSESEVREHNYCDQCCCFLTGYIISQVSDLF